nr:hypothetical protein [Tanacetum cinerariifolium]
MAITPGEREMCSSLWENADPEPFLKIFQVEERKVYKQPSGPNPVGNNRSPTRRLVELTGSYRNQGHSMCIKMIS